MVPVFCGLVPSITMFAYFAVYLEIRLGNPKAAAHVAVRPSVLVTVKH